MIDLALQVVLVVLLLLTITWCMIVHLRLRRLRTEGGEMQAFIAALGEATTRAEAAISLMRDTGREIERAAIEQERRARECRGELGRLVENAARVTQRLTAAREQGAARMAELRTRDDITDEPRQRLVEPSPDASPRADLAPAAPAPAPASPDPERAGRPRPARAKGGQPEARLDGLLHGELLEALQALR
ncbi:MAG: hypothetical protein H6852_05780 [Geminicoccaceae bacterium]|jgi:hypothetical protein|nr:hypothetical protein [Geminicoccaceae bacterium]